MIQAGDIRPGNVLNYKGKLYKVLKADHIKPGKGGAFAQVEMKAIKDGTKLNERFRTDEKIEKAFIDNISMTFSYKTGETYTFINNDSYEQIDLNKEDMDIHHEFLEEGADIIGEFYNSELIGISWPAKATCVCKVTSTDAYIKGQTAKSGYKPAILENGAKVMVPAHVEADALVLIDPSNLEYLGSGK